MQQAKQAAHQNRDECHEPDKLCQRWPVRR
jgi:hypothetical protein